MPEVFHRHYANRPGRNDTVVARGRMDIWQNPLMGPFAFFFRWTKTLIPLSANGVETTVVFRTKQGSPAFWYDRQCVLADGARVSFVSRVEPDDDGAFVEWTGAGIGWRCRFSFDAGRVHLAHRGYMLRIGNMTLRAPLGWLVGRPAASESALNDTDFEMEMTIRHPLFGKLYAYSGEFRIAEVLLDG